MKQKLILIQSLAVALFSLAFFSCIHTDPSNSEDMGTSSLYVKKVTRYQILEKTDSTISAVADEEYCTYVGSEKPLKEIVFYYELDSNQLKIRKDYQCAYKVYEPQSPISNGIRGKWLYSDSILQPNYPPRVVYCEVPVVYGYESRIAKGFHRYEINEGEVISSEEIIYTCFFEIYNQRFFESIAHSTYANRRELIDCNTLKISYSDGAIDIIKAMSFSGDLSFQIKRTLNGKTCTINRKDISPIYSEAKACPKREDEPLKSFKDCVSAAANL